MAGLDLRHDLIQFRSAASDPDVAQRYAIVRAEDPVVGKCRRPED